MTAKFVAEVIDSTAVFKETIFDGKVLFCTGGGSGICKRMTEAVVREVGPSIYSCNQTLYRCDMAQIL